MFNSCSFFVLALQIPGLVKVDFADVRAIMANPGSSLMGIGTATGKRRVFFRSRLSVDRLYLLHGSIVTICIIGDARCICL